MTWYLIKHRDNFTFPLEGPIKRNYRGQQNTDDSDDLEQRDFQFTMRLVSLMN